MNEAACTLGPDDGRARVWRWQQLAAVTNPIYRRSGPVVEISYPPDACVGEELEALVALERQCCQFLEWEVVRGDGAVILRIAADPRRPDDVEPFAARFGAATDDA